jgi:hypothetical protein
MLQQSLFSIPKLAFL